MLLAPIDARQFRQAPRPRQAPPASCRLPQLLRITALACLGGALIFVALGAKSVRAEPVAAQSAIQR